jgi:putative ABC transport system permease protein
VPQVAAVTPIRFGHWLDRGMTSALTAIDPAGLPQAVRISMTAGSLSDLDGGGVVIADTVARDRGVVVGDTLPMTLPRDGEQDLRVVGIIADDSARALSTSFLISLSTYGQHYSENVDATVYVALDPDADQQAARTALKTAVADFPNAEVLDQAEAAAARAAAIDQVLGLITVLLGFAVLIALLGITNTLALSIVERTREIGLLRAVGMTRAQVRSMVRAEAVLIAAVATVAGVGLGLVLASATLAGLATDGSLVIRVPVLPLLIVVAGSVAAGLAAGLLPARRAARLDVLTAIAAQ